MSIKSNSVEPVSRKCHCALRSEPASSTIIKFFSIITLACFVANLPVFGSAQSDETWEGIERSGIEALDKGQYWKAEPLLKQAVIKAGSFGMADIRLGKSLDELGRLYAIRGKFADAEPYLEEALFVKRQALGNGDGQSIPAMGSLIRFYLTGGTAGKADPLTEEVLSFVDGKLSEPTSLNRFKVTLQKGVPLQGWAGTAAPSMGNPAIEWAITCDDLGNLYKDRGNFDLAYRLFRAALDVKSTILGKEHLSLANSYDHLATMYLAKGDDSEAESFYRDALEISERILPPGSSEVYARLDKLAKCLIKSGNYKEAEELYLRAQNCWKTEPSKHGDDARAAYSLGSLYADQKNYSAAATELQRALKLAEQYNGPSSANLVPYLQKYAYVLYYLGRMPEVEQLRALADTISKS